MKIPSQLKTLELIKKLVFCVVGKASVTSSDAQNKLTLLLPIIVAGVQVYENEGRYNIWDTDYDNYALIYSCKEISKFK